MQSQRPPTPAELAHFERWKMLHGALVYRRTHAPLVKLLLSERLVWSGPNPKANWYPRKVQVAQSAVGPARVAVARYDLEKAQRIHLLMAPPGPVDVTSLLLGQR